LATQVEAENPKALREIGDAVRDLLGARSVVALASESPDHKAMLLVMVGKELVGRFKAGELVASMAQAVGGHGGGKPDLAQAGGPDPSGLPKALEVARKLVLEPGV
jgi:alanyl-tRNA synthetase